MMRVIILVFVYILSVEVVTAQQIHQYTQYMFNQYGHNPAVGGSKECVDVKLGYRMQWVGFEGAPRTAYASIHGRIKGKSKGSFKGYHGIGAYIENDETQPSSRTYFYPSYAYHLPLSREVTASAGVFAGIQQYKFDVANVTLYDPVDNAIIGSQSVMVLPDISAGLWLYSKNLYMGLAGKQLLSKKIKGPGGQFGIDSKIVKHYSFTSGYRIPSRGKISYIPSVMFKFMPLAPIAFDLNCMVDYKNRIAVGLSYRNVDAIAALVKFKFFKFFDLGYSFDYTTSKIRIASSNTHEIMLSFNLCAKGGSEKESFCPAYD